MNLELAKKKLGKINRMIETFEPGENHISRLEKDLILGYTREFYEALTEFSNGSTSQLSPKKKSAPIVVSKTSDAITAKQEAAPQAKPELKEEIIIQKYTERTSEDAEKVEQLIIEDAVPAVEEVETPKIETIEPTESKTIVDQPAEVVPEAKTIPAKPAEQTIKSESPAKQSITKPELLELFAIKKANEISEKLSQLPISDLNRAMGVNEKIFVKNELFGGDDTIFSQTLKRLNSFENFDQAKDYLATEVAESFQWTAPDKSKKAKNFIQLVFRRYK